MIKIFVIKPREIPEVIEIENTLSAYQEVVGGFINAIQFFHNVMLVTNARDKELDDNFYLGTQHINGTAFFVGIGKNGRFKNLTKSQINSFKYVMGGK